MATKQKPCTVGTKHSWTFVKNVTLTDVKIVIGSGSRAHIRYRGLYRCAGGRRKYGREGDMPAVASQAAEERTSGNREADESSTRATASEVRRPLRLLRLPVARALACR